MIPRIASVCLGVAMVLPALGEPIPDRVKNPPIHRTPPHIINVLISPDGNRIATAWFRPPINRPGTDWAAWVTVHDLKSGTEFRMSGLHGAMAISSDGKKLIATGYRQTDGSPGRGRIEGPAMWEVETQEVRILPMAFADPPHQGHVSRDAGSIAFSPDDTGLFAAGRDGRIRVWNTEAGGEGREIYRHPRMDDPEMKDRFHIHIERSGDDMVALAGNITTTTTPMPPTFIVFRKERGEWSEFRNIEGPAVYQELVRSGHIGGIHPNRIHQQLKAIVTGASTDGEWNRATRGSSEGGGLAVHPERKLLSIRDRGAVLVRNFPGETLFRLPTGEVRFFTKDGRHLVTTEGGDTVQFWDMETGLLAPSPLEPDGNPGKVHVAAIQAHSQFGDVGANRAKLLHLIERAARDGARIVVLPETALTGYLSDDLARKWEIPGEPPHEGAEGVNPAPTALTADAPELREFSRCAVKTGIYLTIPFVERDRKTGRYYNTVVVFDPEGRMGLHYRKHDAWLPGDGGWMTPGDLGRSIMDTPFGRIGCLICFDIHHQTAQMAELGVDFLLYSIAWVDEEESDWFDKRLPEIARTNQIDIIAANWALPAMDAKADWHGHGQSRIIDRTGTILAHAEANPADAIIHAHLPIRLMGQDRED